MPRPDKAERARRQQLARERKYLAGSELDRDEERQQDLAAVEEDRWQILYAQQEEAREADAYAERAVKGLDELARLVGAYEEGDIPRDEVESVLRVAGHRDFLPERGWCGTGE